MAVEGSVEWGRGEVHLVAGPVQEQDHWDDHHQPEELVNHEPWPTQRKRWGFEQGWNTPMSTRPFVSPMPTFDLVPGKLSDREFVEAAGRHIARTEEEQQETEWTCSRGKEWRWSEPEEAAAGLADPWRSSMTKFE